MIGETLGLLEGVDVDGSEVVGLAVIGAFDVGTEVVGLAVVGALVTGFFDGDDVFGLADGEVVGGGEMIGLADGATEQNSCLADAVSTCV